MLDGTVEVTVYVGAAEDDEGHGERASDKRMIETTFDDL